MRLALFWSSPNFKIGVIPITIILFCSCCTFNRSLWYTDPCQLLYMDASPSNATNDLDAYLGQFWVLEISIALQLQALHTLTLDSTMSYKKIRSAPQVRSMRPAPTRPSGCITTSTQVAGSLPTASRMSTLYSTPSPAIRPAMTLLPLPLTGLFRLKTQLSLR